MTEKELREKLAEWYADVPEDTHAAYAFALTHHRKKRARMRPIRKVRVALALMLLMALLATGAYAVYYRFSVSEYMRNSSQAFRDHVIALDETYENELFTMTVNDAVFDGETFAVALNILRSSEDVVYYLHTEVTAVCAGVTYQGDIEGWSDGPSFHGGLWPDFSPFTSDPTAVERKGFGFEGVLWNGDTGQPPPAGQPVEWTMTFKVFRPLWEIVVDHEADEDNVDERIREAWQNHRILICFSGVNSYIGKVAERLNLPDFSPVEVELPATGAFALADIITVRFTTRFDDDVVKEELVGQRYALGECTAVIDEMEASFQRIIGRIHFEFDRPMTQEELGAYPMPAWVRVICLNAAGEEIGQGFASPSLHLTEEEDRRWEIVCDFYHDGGEAAALVFQGYDPDPVSRETVWRDDWRFTVELP